MISTNSFPDMGKLKSDVIRYVIDQFGIASAALFFQETMSEKTDYLEIKEQLFGDASVADLYNSRMARTYYVSGVRRESGGARITHLIRHNEIGDSNHEIVTREQVIKDLDHSNNRYYSISRRQDGTWAIGAEFIIVKSSAGMFLMTRQLTQ